ncbi:11579_t:CDS:2 [Dentiscutata heterogama]|uniref:11579_t:CDS:1 n=1 Tax=Dentiscutata heterogama TaxID=1316150 RepID=A0ACA9K075_9GLOM|nr:11579_t:CDS:2 [Dentiscutata heterogama]
MPIQQRHLVTPISLAVVSTSSFAIPTISLLCNSQDRNNQNYVELNNFESHENTMEEIFDENSESEYEYDNEKDSENYNDEYNDEYNREDDEEYSEKCDEEYSEKYDEEDSDKEFNSEYNLPLRTHKDYLEDISAIEHSNRSSHKREVQEREETPNYSKSHGFIIEDVEEKLYSLSSSYQMNKTEI